MLAVICGAFGAHALRAHLPAEMLAVFQTATQYQMYHSLGLVLVGLIGERYPEQTFLGWAGWLMIAGIVLFSGSLYTLAITGIR